MGELLSSRVTEIFIDCIPREKEGNESPLLVEGISMNVIFDKVKLGEHSKEIEEMLSQLDGAFFRSIGGGWSFLNLCLTKDGNEWTSFHRTMEELMLLGMGIGKMEYCAPNKEVWKLLPGGLPYIVIND